MGHNINKKMTNKVNVFAVVVICILVFASFVVVNALSGHGDGTELVAVVHDGDGGVHELPLNEDNAISVVSSYGTNVVTVAGSEVFVSEATCDNLDCVHQGKIASPGRQIICLPHKLWIEVVSNGVTQGQMDVPAVNETASPEGHDTLSR